MASGRFSTGRNIFTQFHNIAPSGGTTVQGNCSRCRFERGRHHRIGGARHQEKENIPIVEALAEALGAELAASRPICDAGWLPMERQVGSSGQTVAPKVYIAVGISGAIQHLVGMKGAKTVVAINKDPDAPIFEVADYGIVGDLFEVVPALVEEIKKTKA